ncbi:alpha-L-rhamnosidase [Thermocatellispora tengchongensis]|uniref:alpha-L-rhamnosidase n=1 Tax=Thermocatellispora tengchongensis TaxID=1073253 RepID=A0A840P6H9_9ACTN|nr:alpha-L-rhamnosidase [Thermocatellispora tengchongensis]MBB5135278.1 alpha-L-rhamnosidase [Thermocatellispora tengchongensis]
MRELLPYGLSCELLTEPLGLDEPAPRLAWRLRSGARGARQRAYRVVVRDEGGRVAWDTGRVESARQRAGYAGEPLRPRTRYTWSAEVWDDAEEPAGRAESWFETGLMGGWRASWIGVDETVLPVFDPPVDDDLTANTRRLSYCPHLRRSFGLARRPERARIYASAQGVYRLYVNGVAVTDAELQPGWTDYRHRIPYHAHDVTGLLREGENVLAVVLADGWWSGFVGFDPRRAGKLYGDAPAFLAQLHVDHDDGSGEVIVTDGAWRESRGTLRYSDLLMGEYHDARERRDGWDLPGFDDSAWTPAAVTGGDTSLLTAARAQPVRVLADLPAERTWRGPDGHLIADLGQNMVGRVRLTVRGAARGTRIRLRHAEMLDQDGRLYLANLRRAEATDVYVCAGEPEEVYEPAFTFHGFRYVEVAGWDDVEVTGRAMHSDTPWTGEFTCDDAMVNRLHENIRWGQRGNFLSVPTDCPQRDERLGWLADAQVFLPTAARGADVAAFFANWMEDVLAGQDADGAFPDVAPLVCLTREGAPAWGDAGVIIPWTLYRLYGDDRVLRRCYPAMTRWVDHIRRHNPDLIWRRRTGRHYGDWLQIGAETPREVLATAYFARSAELTGRAARVLGEHEDAARHEELAAAVRAAFAREFVTEDGRIEGDTQTCYLLALEFGLLPEHLRDAAAAHLARDVEKNGDHLTTGFIGVSLLCPVLTRIGRADLAYALLHQEGFPGWLFSVKQGATTIWERWDGWTPERGFQSPNMNSFNHYSLGAVGEWLYGGVAGIGQEPDSVAYEKLTLAPRPGGRLTRASAVQETARGRVESAWSVTGATITLDVLIPPGAEATVRIPTSDPGRVAESARPIGECGHVTVLGHAGQGDGALVCAVASGRYRFTAPWAANEPPAVTERTTS